MNKKLILFENSDIDEKHYLKSIHESSDFQKGHVIFRDPVTNEDLYEDDNVVTVAGSAYTMAKHWNKKVPVLTPSYNEVLALDNTVREIYEGEGIRKEESVYLFCVGIDGCNDDNRKLEEDPTKWIDENNIIPFRYQPDVNDIPDRLRDKYYGRKVLKSTNKIAYYFKAFESVSELKQQYLDGTPIDENIYLSSRKDKVENYIEILLKITKEDCRAFFEAHYGLDEAKINSISLCTAWAKEIEGHIVYQDIRPLTKLNFPSELLSDPTKGIDIIYQLFY